MKLADIIKLKLNNFEIKVVKEGFPIPSPSADEDENSYIGRCMKEIGNEYDQEQALAICYSKWKGE